MNLDIAAGILCFVISAGVFLLHVLTGPRHGGYPAAPEYVRHGMLVLGCMLLWRAVDMIQLADFPADPGHIDAKAMMAIIALAYLVAALSYWAARSRLPAATWDRLRYAFRSVRRRPELMTAVMTGHDVAEAARSAGYDVIEASEGAGAISREVDAHK